MEFLIFFLGVLAGTAKAGRDTIAHHFPGSIFGAIENVKIRKWFESDYNDRPNHWFSPIWDGWHFFDSITIVSPVLCFGIVVIVVGSVIFLYLVGFMGSFLIFYKRLFLK